MPVGTSPTRIWATPEDWREGGTTTDTTAPLDQSRLNVFVDITAAVKTAIANGELDDNGGGPGAQGEFTTGELFIGAVWGERPIYFANDPLWNENRQTLLENKNSYLRLTFGSSVVFIPTLDPSIENGDDLKVSFPTESGVTYQGQTSLNLIDWDDEGSVIVGDGSTANITFERDGATRIFARVRVVPGGVATD
jgi:hypothetical protein